MKDEQPKKVVRRVVAKKTVVRPVSDVGRDEAAARRPAPRGPVPRARTVTNPHTGRTVTIGTTTGPADRAQTERAQTEKAQVERARTDTPTGEATSAPRPAPLVPRRSPRDVLDDWRLAAAERRSSAGRAVRRGSASAGRGLRDVVGRVTGVRLPHWPDLRAVAVTAVVTGLLLVLLGWCTLELFDRIFGVKSGGAWGVLAFAVLAVVGFAVTRTLLRWFGHPAAGIIAGLAQLIGIVLLLVFLPTDAQSRWSLLVVPLVSLAAHLLSAGAARLAEDEEAHSGDDVDEAAAHVSMT